MKITDKRFVEILLCVECRQNTLRRENEKLNCSNCQTEFLIQNGKVVLLDKDLSAQYARYQKEIKSPINRLKSFIKRWPWLFQFLTYAIGSVSFFTGSPSRAAKKYIGENNFSEKIIINIGSGITRFHEEIINLDIFPFENVDLVTDATKFPIKDASVDMIITESTLEHIPNADLAIKEICRVVKPGGYVFASIPFVFPFHASPNDFMRLTEEGLKRRFDVFEPVKIGMRGGPASALVTFLMHFLALPFSIISTGLYNFMTYILMAVLSPLRVLDLVFYFFPRSLDAAAMVYFIGKKKG